MNTSEIIEAIDQEILKLQQARALLADAPAVQATKPVAVKSATGKRRGRPKGSVNKKAEIAAPVVIKPAKRTLTAEGKARIAAAQKARWAAQKKTSKPAKAAAKKITAKVRKKVAVPAKKSVAELQA
jgi:hypothetical protein